MWLCEGMSGLPSLTRSYCIPFPHGAHKGHLGVFTFGSFTVLTPLLFTFSFKYHTFRMGLENVLIKQFQHAPPDCTAPAISKHHQLFQSVQNYVHFTKLDVFTFLCLRSKHEILVILHHNSEEVCFVPKTKTIVNKPHVSKQYTTAYCQCFQGLCFLPRSKLLSG